ncbi:MAG: ugdH [Rhizobium sp.]|nr:ugdH [Rhizobium sp.]
MSVKIAMIGTGYVGLVTGACFAEVGHDVVCVDSDQRKIAMLLAGEIPIYEPALDDLVQRNVAAGRLRFSTSTEESVKDREAIFLAVGTPSDPVTGRANLDYVFKAASEVALALERFAVLVTKSTVPVGTNHKIYQTVVDNLSRSIEVAVASNPEFLREGAAIQDFMQPDRIVIGVEDERAAEIMKRIYAPFTGSGISLLITNIATAEMIKYAANAFLAVKVSYINEVADLCEAVGAKIDDVATGIGMDHRIGASFLRTGPGWGGSCFPKDTRAMLMTARDSELPARIVQAAIDANEARKGSMTKRVRDIFAGDLRGKRIAVFGLTFKGQTDDMRESPSLDILSAICTEGALVTAYDPSFPREAGALLPEVKLSESATDAAQDAELLVVLTDWMIFKTFNLADYAKVMKTPRMLDLRNMYDAKSARSAGFSYYENLGHGHVATIGNQPN